MNSKTINTILVIIAISFMACNANQKPNETNTSNTSIPSDSSISQPITHENQLIVYAFHGTRQCTTCKNMKSNTKAALEQYYSEQLKSGKIQFYIIDVDDPINEKIAEKFQATGTALMINNIKNKTDNISDWSDFAFEKANDKNQFIPELKQRIDNVLKQ
jgi:thioredoxin-related protein